jgi:hypothetical protein
MTGYRVTNRKYEQHGTAYYDLVETERVGRMAQDKVTFWNSKFEQNRI